MRHVRAKRVDPACLKVCKRMADGADLTRVLHGRWAALDHQYDYWLQWMELQAPKREDVPQEVVARLAKLGLVTAPPGDVTFYTLTPKGRQVVRDRGLLVPPAEELELFDQPGQAPWRMKPATQADMDGAR